jgi:precorrin-6B methylase 2
MGISSATRVPIPGGSRTSAGFYHELIQLPYPFQPAEQCVPILFDDTRLQFLALNSAWEIDEYHRERASINQSALAAGLLEADEQVARARRDGRMAQDSEVLRIAVWHHPVTGNEKISDDAFLDQLRQEHVKLCLHGHVHEDRADVIGYLHPRRAVHIAGAGSFGAPVNARPESTPRLYNLLEGSGAITARAECTHAACAQTVARGRAGLSGKAHKPPSDAPIMTFSSKANVMQHTVAAQFLAGSVKGRAWLSTLGLLLLCTACMHAQYTAVPGADTPIYETRAEHHPDGIGKFYMGREIARVMGVAGAEWLDRPERAEAEAPQQVIEHMQLKPTDVVADVGAGTGYFTMRISRVVPQGTVYAVDIQPEMLAIIEQHKRQLKADNVITVQGTETDPRLPAQAVDVALLVDAYHEFAYPREMMENIVKSLKPGGRVIQIEYRGEDATVPIKSLHKMTVAQARKEMEAVGLRWQETQDFLPYQHFIVFVKP